MFAKLRDSPDKRFISSGKLGRLGIIHTGNLKVMSEQREARRTGADYFLEFSVAGRDRFGVGQALDHSETGMSFHTDQPLILGSYLTMRVPLRSKNVPVLTCLANVVRCLTLPDGTGYEVGCAYD